MEIKSTNQLINGLDDLNQDSLFAGRKKIIPDRKDNIDAAMISQIDKKFSVSQDMGAEDIQQIRSQLKSGEFDSPESIRAAAENMLHFGI